MACAKLVNKQNIARCKARPTALDRGSKFLLAGGGGGMVALSKVSPLVHSGNWHGMLHVHGSYINENGDEV